MQADRLQVLFHSLVVLDLSWDRNGHRLTAGTTNEFNRLAAKIKEEATQECTVRSDYKYLQKVKAHVLKFLISHIVVH